MFVEHLRENERKKSQDMEFLRLRPSFRIRDKENIFIGYYFFFRPLSFKSSPSHTLDYV
jgi:hypothetical protein